MIIDPIHIDSPTVLPGESPVPLESVLCTEELNLRPQRSPDYEKENRMLVALAQSLADSPSSILQQMTDMMVEMFSVGSAGFSLISKDDGGKTLYWPAISGMWKAQIGGGTSRGFVPCGDVLDRNAPLLFKHPERRYTYFLPVTPPVEECLLAPFYIEGKAVGTIWVIAHDEHRKFDAEDLRQLVSLGKFASSAYQTAESHEKTLLMNEQLMLGSLRQHELTDIADSLNGLLQMEITERKQAQNALRASEDRFRSMADNISQLAWTCDKLGDVNWYNQRWFDYTGLSFEEMKDWGWKAIHHPDHIDRVVTGVQLSRASGEPWEDTFPLRGKNGEYRWFLSRAMPVRGESGSIIRWFGTNTDVTERRMAEESLQQEKQRAQAANIAKSEFLANMSHEIRTPMNAVLGLANILAMADDMPKEKQLEIVNTLQLSAQSLLGLINDLLDIAKIETNSMDLERIPFTFDEVISEVFSILSLKAREKNIELDYVNLPSHAQKFFGDPLRIRQVLINLVGNALKFTEQGCVTVNVTTSAHEEPQHSYVHVAVSDTGIGIAPNKLEGIFEKFTQADSSTTRKYGGTGLGLAISKNLAEIMGGSITIKSDQGKGSEFTLHLPLELADEASAHLPIAEDNQEETSEFQAVHGCVLLAEDYKPNVLVASLVLESLGYSCEVANNGREALEKIRANRGKYVAVLMDVQMPDMDGFEATKIIREEEKAQGLPHLSIIAMTAHALEGDRERCLKAGMDDYISKPFAPQDLANKLAAASLSLDEIPQF